MDERECAFRQNEERDAARPRGASLAHQQAIAAVCVSRLPVLLLSGTTSSCIYRHHGQRQCDVRPHLTKTLNDNHFLLLLRDAGDTELYERGKSGSRW